MLKHEDLQNGMVAVKKVTTWTDFTDKLFLDEITCLKKVRHKNIVRFLGYCADSQGEVLETNGKNVIAEERHRFLCFEYVPNGDLQHYLEEKPPHGYEWNMRYHIIKGICQGLDYLEQKRILHLDLKPANVLLGVHMVPKITDFGLSRHINENQSTIPTETIDGTLGYVAPEIIGGQISLKADIYSLGIIIIRLLTGITKAIPEDVRRIHY
ncbi:hypothetical protein PR202_gb13433 [Eleusine coracana subsp. coracana]|uniref:non-specific serine/threonine protein kinase n=1 Tax=Eleusine coracana subsp. coracana TaxID=191504 RepID=A0AAV5ESV5_ELECO|nr:hypothetical protein PR202_gb13433 [Eleusine coracana subsp. coracana]